MMNASSSPHAVSPGPSRLPRRGILALTILGGVGLIACTVSDDLIENKLCDIYAPDKNHQCVKGYEPRQEKDGQCYCMPIRQSSLRQRSAPHPTPLPRTIAISTTHHRRGNEAFGGSGPRAVLQRAQRSENLSEHGHEPAEGRFAGSSREGRRKELELDDPPPLPEASPSSSDDTSAAISHLDPSARLLRRLGVFSP